VGSAYEHDIDVLVPLSEDDLRARLTRVGLSQAAVDERISLARGWCVRLAKDDGPRIILSDPTALDPSSWS